MLGIGEYIIPGISSWVSLIGELEKGVGESGNGCLPTSSLSECPIPGSSEGGGNGGTSSSSIMGGVSRGGVNSLLDDCGEVFLLLAAGKCRL